jgi:dTMP kinase
MPRGKLIVIEGTDCSGKQTQTQKLVQRLIREQFKIKSLGFPDYSTFFGNLTGLCYLGKDPNDSDTGLTNQFIDLTKIPVGSWAGEADKVHPLLASTLFAGNRFEIASQMREDMSQGYHILCDRYVESNMAHQGGKIRDSKERGIFLEKLDLLEYQYYELPKPDLVVFLHMPYEASLRLRERRSEKPDGHESNPDHLINAEQCYLELAKKYDWKKIACGVGNRAFSRDKIHDSVYQIVSDFLATN